jgi:hypothetical protein
MDSTKNYSEVSAPRPVRAGARTNLSNRVNPFGDQTVQPMGKDAYGFADEGSYFVARNPTIGTGIAGIAAATTASDLETLLYIRNGASAADGTRIYLDYLRLVPTAAGTNGTTTVFYSWIDSGERYTSGGSTITPVNCNQDSGTTTNAAVRFGALVTTAASSAKRTVGGGALRLGVIKVIGDIYQFDFGGYRQDLPPTVTSGTAQIFFPWRHAPVVLGPGQCFGLEVFAASQSVAASFEFELGYFER